MDQKEVKIIGLKVNEKLGILNAFHMRIDQDSHMIAIKGEVGSGKTTLKKAMELGTQGSETLRHDKALLGDIDQEVQLLDGETPIFVGCKTKKEGGIDYVVYTRNEEGKRVNEPVIDGVKLTPSTYLKSMQTALTWRMNELTSENPTDQKKILLELYKGDLAELGVVFDKAHPQYVGSILDKIEKAENTRAEKDYARKQIGGYKHHLEDKGIDVDSPPERADVSGLEEQRNKLQYDINNVLQVKEGDKKNKLIELKGKADEINNKLRDENVKLKQINTDNYNIYLKKSTSIGESKRLKESVNSNLKQLSENGYLDAENLATLNMMVNEMVKIVEPEKILDIDTLQFDENGKCTNLEFMASPEIDGLIKELISMREEYKLAKDVVLTADSGALEKELEVVVNNLILAKDKNEICDAVKSYLEWSEADTVVQDLKNEFSSKLAQVNTGVDGLQIKVEENMDIFLKYNGAYDSTYFSNPEGEFRKVSSYSSTQRPLICLLLQNYLLSKKPKALRYMWIDDVPIDNKTKALLNRMGVELNLTIFVNITGDFDREGLESGEILIEGGEVFFD